MIHAKYTKKKVKIPHHPSCYGEEKMIMALQEEEGGKESAKSGGARRDDHGCGGTTAGSC
jgi:hypothetical protein